MISKIATWATAPRGWQRSLLPAIYQPKVCTIFDGIDTGVWRPETAVRRIGDRVIPDDMRIVTYVARGMESMRGFDIFMKIARLLCQSRQDVLFVVVGEDRICYGGDADFTGNKSFKDWVLARDDYDLSRFIFTGHIPTAALVQLFAISDLHIYLTVPFVLSWSLMNALACGTTVLASNTAPVREMIRDGVNGLLADFFDIEGLASQAAKVLDAPEEFKHLGQAGVEMIRERYSLEVCLPRMLALYEDAFHAAREV